MIEQWLRHATQVGQAKYDEEEKAAEGNLRGGNAGCVTANGMVVGNCHRVAILRAEGIQFPPDGASEMYFATGRAVEDQIAKMLALNPAVKVQREEACQVSWQLESGRWITGRPDFLFVDNDDKPVRGLELKTVCSASTAETVYLDHHPKVEHLCQAGHYMLNLGCPWELLYWNGNTFDAGYFRKKQVGNWKLKIPPFRAVYKLDYAPDGVLRYQLSISNGECDTVVTDKLIPTIITMQGIKDYYGLVDELITKKDIGPDLDHVYPDGTPIGWDHAKYCRACGLTKKHSGYDAWLGAARLFAAKAE